MRHSQRTALAPSARCSAPSCLTRVMTSRPSIASYSEEMPFSHSACIPYSHFKLDVTIADLAALFRDAQAVFIVLR